jgi:hypothetical protein
VPKNCTDNIFVLDFIHSWLQPGGQREIKTGNRLNGVLLFTHICITRLKPCVKKTNHSRLGQHYATISIVFALILCACFAACSEPPKPAGPKFTGRVLFLSGDPANGSNLVELTPATSAGSYNLSTITGGVVEAVSSPDQSRLLYATKEDISVRDLHSGNAKSLIKGETFCLAWATDGNHFSYKQKSGVTTKLFAADLDGKSKLVLDDPNGSVACAIWIAPDRLVFDRFVGATAKKGTEQLKPNTATVATISEPVKLKDTPKKWSVEAVCAKNNNGLLRSDQGRLLIAKNIDHFESLDPSPGPCSECRFVGYATQSCLPFFIEQPTSTTTELFSLNPTSWQKQTPASITWTFSTNARMLIKSSARLMVVGDAPDKLLLIDTETGEVTPFFSKSAPTGISLVSPLPIVWIEN